MTAMRILIGIIAAALALGAAWLLWPTVVPDDLDLVGIPLPVPPEDVERARDYARVARLFVLGALLAPLLAVTALASDAPRLARRLPGSMLVRSLGMLGVVLVVAWLARLPFRAGLHWWRRRHGLSEQGYLDWLLAPWLGTLAFVAAAALALVAAIWLARRLGRRWWLAAAALLALLGAVLVLVQPLVLAPRLDPLRDRQLAAQIEALARRAGIGDVEVEVRRVSDRTRSLNAEVAGIGPTRRVVLWDTLLRGSVTRREARHLAAHEIAHVERRHLWKGLGWFLLATPLLAYGVAWATRRRGGITAPEAVPAAALALLVLQLALLPGANFLSRRYEAEADWRALDLARDPEAAESLFRRLVGANLVDPDPPLWAEVALATHPSLEERAAMVAAWEGRGAP
jgi:STE24 endopeptidase